MVQIERKLIYEYVYDSDECDVLLEIVYSQYTASKKNSCTLLGCSINRIYTILVFALYLICSKFIFRLYKFICKVRKLWLCSVQFSSSVVSDSLWPHESQHIRPPCPSPTPRVHSDTSPLSRWCHPALSSSISPSPPAPNPSQHQSLFQWVNSLHEMAKVLEFQLQHQSFQWIFRTDFL